ncbi:hypothetical protein EXIGLDRAFT_602653, partial [Exidia glandulosa HHB12029]
LFGATGTGKSSFINAALGSGVQVGHGLRSCTQDLQIVWGSMRGVDFGLVDGPGFDDTVRDEANVLRDICTWLAEAYRSGAKIVGVIYLHRITDPRMGGSAVKNLRYFREICGEDAMSHVILCTTRWDEVKQSEGEMREQLLRDDFWRSMLARGSTLKRHDNTPASARRIVAEVMKNGGIDLKVQEEMVDEGKSFEYTSAAHGMREEMERLTREHEAEMRRIRETEEARQREMLAIMKAAAEEERKMADQRILQLQLAAIRLQLLRLEDEPDFICTVQ